MGMTTCCDILCVLHVCRARIAQLGERPAVYREVGGSSPSTRTSRLLLCLLFFSPTSNVGFFYGSGLIFEM